MHMKVRVVILLSLLPYVILSECPNLRTDFKSIRKRRYVAFPEGSDVVLTLDLATAFLTHVPSGWYVTMDLDSIYPLPDKDFVSRHLRRKLHHRQKKELWNRLKDALSLRNMNGHACVLRSICEAKVFLAPPGKSLVHDLLRAVFTAPIEDREFAEEVGEDMFTQLSDPNFCDRVPDCPFSLLHFLLGFNEKRKK